MPVKIDIFKNAVTFDNKWWTSHYLYILYFAMKLLGYDKFTVRQVAKAGEKETIGKSGSYAPPAGDRAIYSIWAPAILRRCLLFM